MRAFYNEIDRYCCDWLQNLMDDGQITPGKIDDRPIQELGPADVAGYERVHFFAGIAGWDLALNLAGWGNRFVWTGSCPCQPFSAAGQGKAADDERHLWPAWFSLIRECRPPVVFGEQVEAAIGWGWLDLVCADLEAEGYACGAAVLPACGVGAPHIRQRVWFVAKSAGAGLPSEPQGWIRGDARSECTGELLPAIGTSGGDGELADAADGRRESVERVGGIPAAQAGNVAISQSGTDSHAGLLADANGRGFIKQRAPWPGDRRQAANGYDADGCGAGELADGIGARLEVEREQSARDQREAIERGGAVGELENATGERCEGGIDTGQRQRTESGGFLPAGSGPARSPWSDLVWLPCSDGKARPTFARLQFVADGLSAGLGPLRSRQEEEMNNGQAAITRSDQALSCLRQGADTEVFQERVGGPDEFSSAEILRSSMHGRGHDRRDQSHDCSEQPPSINTDESTALRALWQHIAASCSPSGPEPVEQRAIQSHDVMRGLSHARALARMEGDEVSAEALQILQQACEASGAVQYALHSLSHEWRRAISASESHRRKLGNGAFGMTGVSPLATGISNRVARLRAYGNAIVPQVAAEFIKSCCACKPVEPRELRL